MYTYYEVCKYLHKMLNKIITNRLFEIDNINDIRDIFSYSFKKVQN